MTAASRLSRIAAVSALGLVVSCGGGSGGSGGGSAPDPVINSACFQGGTTPQIKLGDGFAGADWNDPHVIKVGSQYWMYASSNLGLFNPPTPPSPVQIYRFTSSDASTWTLDPATPVLSVAPSQWDQGGNETPAVVFF